MTKVKGIVAFIDAPERKKENFSKQLFGIKTDDQNFYFEVINEKQELLSGIKVGDTVSVEFAIRCSDWNNNGKTHRFVSLRPAEIEKV